MSDWLDDLGSRNEELRQETRADIAELRQEMRATFEKLQAEMRVGFAALSGELQAVEKRTAQQIGKLLMWATGVWVATIAILIAVSGPFRR